MSRKMKDLQEALKYQGKLFGNQKVADMLKKRARLVLNSSPEPAHQIVVDRLQLDMAEKERVGLIFNRTVTESMADRWRYLESLNVQFLQEIVNMEDQIKDDLSKCEREINAFLADRTHIFALKSQYEQMMGMAMHINFYKEILELKINTLRKSAHFLQKVTESLGFNHPTQVIDRYESLKLIFEELFTEFEERSNVLNALQEEYNGVMEMSIQQNMLDHIKMAEMYEHMKNLKTQNTEIEKFLTSKLEFSTNAAVIVYKVKISIHQIYLRVMEYRGLEPVETQSQAQLEEVENRIKATESVVKLVQEDIMNDFRKSKVKQKKKERAILEKAAERSASILSGSVARTSSLTPEDTKEPPDQKRRLSGQVMPNFAFINKKTTTSAASLASKTPLRENRLGTSRPRESKVRVSKSNESYNNSENEKSTREMRRSESVATDGSTKIQADETNQSKSIGEETEAEQLSSVEQRSILDQPLSDEIASNNSHRLDKSNSRKCEPQTNTHQSFGCMRDVYVPRNSFLKRGKNFNSSAAGVTYHSKQLAGRVMRESKASLAASNIQVQISSSSKDQQSETPKCQGIQDFLVGKKPSENQPSNKFSQDHLGFKHGQGVIKKMKPTEGARIGVKELCNTQTMDKIIQHQTLNEHTSRDKKSENLTSENKPNSHVYSVSLSNLKLAKPIKQPSSTAKRFSMKTNNLKMLSDFKAANTIPMNKLGVLKTKATRPLHSLNRTYKPRASRYFPSLTPSQGKHQSSEKPSGITSLPDLSQRQTPSTTWPSVSSKFVRSTLDSRRSLSTLSASRRTLRENCLNILAAVQLHPQKVVDIAGHEDI